MKDTKIQWHPAFVAAMGLELKQNRDDLIFEKEYNLNTKPLEIDLLVIKKTASVQIISEIGRLFKGHNIVEYKSPEDHLDIDTFYKKPVELFHYFKEHGCIITETCRGIYYIEGKTWFPTQIIVTSELNQDSHEWLMALSGKLKKEDIRKLLGDRNSLTEKQDRDLADSVLEVSIGANKKIVDELIGDENMYEVLMEIMEPKLRVKRIQEAVDLLRDMNHTDVEIKATLMKRYGLTESEAEEYIYSNV